MPGEGESAIGANADVNHVAPRGTSESDQRHGLLDMNGRSQLADLPGAQHSIVNQRKLTPISKKESPEMAAKNTHGYPNEPIAIVGSACRFPGDSSSPSKLWDLLREPRDVLQEIPDSRCKKSCKPCLL